jgi:hypothetical protein
VTTYYVSPAGSDSNAGTSTGLPWKTIAKVNATSLNPGDSVLFQGGQTWTGTRLYLTSLGTALSPITIGTYGAGTATITMTGADACLVYDAGGYNFTAGLAFQADTSYNGLEFYCDGASQLPAISVVGVTATGSKWGVIVGAANAGGGYNGINVSGCNLSGNVYAGLWTWGPVFSHSSPAYAHSNLTISNITADACLGNSSDTTQWSGSGIVISSVNGGTGDLLESHGCGTQNGCLTEGPAGVWMYACNAVHFTRVLAYQTSSGLGVYDGDGVDIDIDCTGCSIRYIVAYENDGAGALAFAESSDGFWGQSSPNTIAYALLWGNGRGGASNSNYYGDLTLAGQLNGLQAYGITAISQDYAGATPSPLTISDATLGGVYLRNSILYQNGSGPVIAGAAASNPSMLCQGNAYWPAGNGIEWGAGLYQSLAAWRAAGEQEILGSQATGWDIAPGLVSPGTAPSVTDPSDFSGAAGMKLTAASRLAGRGLDLDGIFGVSPGTQDAYGNTLSVPLWVGAYQGAAQPAPLFDVRTELLLGGYWTDISPLVYERANVVIGRGHPDESTTAQPSTLTSTWNNRDGRFSSKNPAGAFYGNLGRNTQVRVSIPEQAPYLRLETDAVSYVQAPDSAALSVTGDTEIAMDVTLDNWRADQLLACKWANTGTQTSWILLLNEDGTLTFTWSDGVTTWSATSTVSVPWPALRRQVIDVTMAYATGTVIFYTAPTIGGSYAQLGATVIVGATTGVMDSTAPVQAGYGHDAGTGYAGVSGRIHEFILKNGIGGTVVADAVFASATAGAHSYTDAYSNTWTNQAAAEISDRRYRGYFELSATPQAWDPTGTDIYCDVQGGGLLRRIQQNTQTLGSAFTRALPAAVGLVGYWPCEDGNATPSGATPATPTQFASAIRGVQAGTFTGTPQFASDSTFLCSQSLPGISKSRWHFTLPSRSAQDSSCIFRFLMHVPSTGDTDGGTMARMFTAGTISQVDLVYNTASSGSLRLLGFNYLTGPSPVFDSTVLGIGVNGLPLWVSVELVTNGSGVKWRLATMEPGATASTNQASGTVSSSSIGNGTTLVINALNFIGGEDLDGSAAGQITYQSEYESLDDFAAQLAAWAGEPAGTRFERLCSEQGIPFRAVGSLSDTVLMGAQTPLAFTSLLQECADADRGQIFEPREVLALGYRTRRSLQNQPAGITLAYTSAQLADPMQETEDDQYTVNDETVTRAYGSGGGTGSSYEAVQESGPLSVQPPPDGVGEYPNADTINLYLDSQLPDEAGWIVRCGTVDEPRYPQILINLARPQISGDATLFYGVPALDLGDRLLVGEAPVWLPPDGIDQLANASTENLNAFVCTIALCCVPGQPYLTAVVSDPVYGRVDTDGSTLAAGVSATATTLSVATTAGTPTVLWTTDSSYLPFDIRIGAERITVTAISGTSSPQSFTGIRSVNGVSQVHNAGDAVGLFTPAIVSL